MTVFKLIWLDSYETIYRLVKANLHIPCRSPAALIHTGHAATLPSSDSAVSFVKVRVVDGNIRTASPATTLYSNNLRGNPSGSRKKPNAGRSPIRRLWTADANSHIPCRSHAALMPRCAVALRRRFQNSIVVAWQGNGMGKAWYVWISLKCDYTTTKLTQVIQFPTNSCQPTFNSRIATVI
jgi:hypothetical protein